MEYRSLDFSGDDSVYGRNAWLDSGFGVCDSTCLLDDFHTTSTLPLTRILGFSLRSHAEWRSVLADASVFGPRRDARTWETGHYFCEFYVAETCDDVVDFWEHLCQTQVPGVAGTPGVSLLGVPARCTIRS